MSVKLDKGVVFVITDKEFGVLFGSTPNLHAKDYATVLTVRDDATMEERLAAMKEAAAIVAARGVRT